MANPIPRPVIATVSKHLAAEYTHSELNNLFWQHNAPGDAPVGNKQDKCMEWLERIGEDQSLDALEVLGGLLQDFMDREHRPAPTWGQQESQEEHPLTQQREEIKSTLARHGLTYMPGGRIIQTGGSLPTKTLEQMLRERDFPSVEQEFQRAMDNAATDPATAITAACATIEALCKAYIHDHDLEPPKDKTVSPLWQVVKKHLNLDPKSQEDQDLRKILQGLGSVVEGLGALRTHAGNAHGQGKTPYTVHPRHARLAINAAHTLAVFVMERWNILDESSSAKPGE